MRFDARLDLLLLERDETVFSENMSKLRQLVRARMIRYFSES